MSKTMILSSMLLVLASTSSQGAEISGQYLETRTCQVYTGPCFANAEMGLAGKDAVMAWSIGEGQHNGVDLKGLKVILALNSTTTLGHGGIDDAENLKSVIYVDERATAAQREALIDFVRAHAGKAGQTVVRVQTSPIEMSLNESELQGKLAAGQDVKIETRKALPTDCLCMNEVAFYPPLAKVENFAAGVTTIGEFQGRGLGSRWSTPDSRSAYMARFAY